MNNVAITSPPSHYYSPATSGANRRSSFVEHRHALTHAATATRVYTSACAHTEPARPDKPLQSLQATQHANRTKPVKKLFYPSNQPVVQAPISQTAIEFIVNCGSQVKANGTVSLRADNQINLLASKSTSQQTSSNSASGSSVGVSYGTSGLTVNASANKSKGQGNGDDVTYTNTRIQGSAVKLKSAGDTTLQGAVIAAGSVQADIGGNLCIESLQDKSSYQETQKSSGFSVSAGAGIPSGSISSGKTNINSRYQSVGEQSGIKAGDGGFNVNVKGQTSLTGGVITSSDKAQADKLNSFNGNTPEGLARLSTQDIQNTAAYNAKSTGISIGTSPGSNSAGFGSQSGNASSTTQSGITGLAGNKTARTGDAQVGLKPIFDKDKTKADVQAQVQITQEFGKQAPKIAADYAGSQAKDLKTQASQEADPAKRQALLGESAKWEEGGIYRVAMHTVIGGLAGGASGALGAGSAASAAPLIDQLQSGLQAKLEAAGVPPSVAKASAAVVGNATAAGIGAAAGGGSGAAMAFNVDANNRQLHPTEKQRIKELAGGDPNKEARLTAAGCALVHCADGVPKDDPSYAYLKALQDAGDTMGSEKALLKQQTAQINRNPNAQLFGYDESNLSGDKAIDWATQNKVGTRIVGAVQGVAGVAGVAGSAALCTTGAGCVAGAVTGTVSADYAQSGIKQAVTGNTTVPYGEQVLQSLGLSPQAAAITYGVLGVAPVVVEAVAVNRAVNATASTNAAARQSYEPITSFGAQGVKPTVEVMNTPQAQAIVREYQAAGLSEESAKRYAENLIQTGTNLPVSATAGQGVELIKVVPKSVNGADSVTGYTPFFMTRQEFDNLSRLPSDQIAQRLGLPAEQGVRGTQLGFDAYAITPKPGATPKVFVSDVAPVQQGSYSAPGGAQQILVPNRSQWTEPVKIGTVRGNK